MLGRPRAGWASSARGFACMRACLSTACKARAGDRPAAWPRTHREVTEEPSQPTKVQLQGSLVASQPCTPPAATRSPQLLTALLKPSRLWPGRHRQLGRADACGALKTASAEPTLERAVTVVCSAGDSERQGQQRYPGPPPGRLSHAPCAGGPQPESAATAPGRCRAGHSPVQAAARPPSPAPVASLPRGRPPGVGRPPPASPRAQPRPICRAIAAQTLVALSHTRHPLPRSSAGTLWGLSSLSTPKRRSNSASSCAAAGPGHITCRLHRT